MEFFLNWGVCVRDGLQLVRVKLHCGTDGDVSGQAAGSGGLAWP